MQLNFFCFLGHSWTFWDSRRRKNGSAVIAIGRHDPVAKKNIFVIFVSDRVILSDFLRKSFENKWLWIDGACDTFPSPERSPLALMVGETPGTSGPPEG